MLRRRTYQASVLYITETNQSSVVEVCKRVAHRFEGRTLEEDLALAAVLDGDRLRGGAALRSDGLHLLNDVHALDDLAEYNVLAVEPRGLCGAEEKLGPIGVLASIGHRQNSWPGVGKLKVLVLKLVAVDRLSAGAVAAGKVTTLAHEARNDAVELACLEAEALLAGAQRAEVLTSLRNNITSELHNDTAGRLASDVNVEEALGRHFGLGCEGT